MSDLRLRLVNEKGFQMINLSRYDPEKSIIQTLAHSNSRIYQDHGYRIYIENSEDLVDSNVSFRINNDEIPVMISSDNELLFDGYRNGRIFEQSYGYIQIQVVVNKYAIYESELIPVMVKKGIENVSVRRMTEFIYQNNAILLSTTTNVPKFDDNVENIGNKTIEAKLVLLKKILSILETNYAYFKINSRYRTEHVEKTDFFEKLQYVSSSTIQYIAQHPDELKRTTGNTGIVINGHRYQPERTLITQNQINYDIEENRAILSFVDRLSYDISILRNDVSCLIQRSEYDSYEEDDYISSTYYVYISTMNILLDMKKQIEEFEKRAIAIQLAYHTIFCFASTVLIDLPRPSALFLAIPQYKQVYDCMREWILRADIGVQQQNQILGLKKMSEIYELYVLLKLVKYFENSGFHLVARKREVYSFDYRSLYRNTRHHNSFRFEKDNKIITMYYQPVIYSDRRSMVHGLGLYRNTTLPEGGEYYSPDYIIKYETDDQIGARYIILDAKFSDVRTVKKYRIKDLVFKYLFSIATLDSKDVVDGLFIVNGQSNKIDDSLTDVYDRREPGIQIVPRVEILTLTENSDNSIDLHTKLIDKCFNSFFN